MTNDQWMLELMWRRKATYYARFLSWKYNRPIVAPVFEDHWLHMPMMYADTRLPVTVKE